MSFTRTASAWKSSADRQRTLSCGLAVTILDWDALAETGDFSERYLHDSV